MAFCVLKNICGCIDLKYGSTILGFIVLVLKIIWLGVCIADVFILSSYMFSDKYVHSFLLKLGYSLTIMHLVTLILQVIFICVILVGLSKKNRTYIEAYKPSVVCYLIECVIFVLCLCYAHVNWHKVYDLLIFISDVLVKLLTPFFLLAVRSHYLQTGDLSETAIVYSAIKETSELHDSAIIITI